MATNLKAFAVQKVLQQTEVVLPDNGTASPAIALNGLTLVGIKFPAGVVSTALTFTVSDAIDGTFVPLTSSTSGTALSYTIAASKYLALDPKDFYGVNFLKLVFGSSETGGPLTIVCSLKGF